MLAAEQSILYLLTAEYLVPPPADDPYGGLSGLLGLGPRSSGRTLELDPAPSLLDQIAVVRDRVADLEVALASLQSLAENQPAVARLSMLQAGLVDVSIPGETAPGRSGCAPPSPTSAASRSPMSRSDWCWIPATVRFRWISRPHWISRWTALPPGTSGMSNGKAPP